MNYIGKELEIFQHAINWKTYYSKFLRPFLKGDVLEVGAGIGSTTQTLCDGSQKSWTCLEPDPNLFDQLQRRLQSTPSLYNCKPIKGTLQDLAADKKFSTILYIDVIEHVENDKVELDLAKQFLQEGGHLIILSPAYPFLFSPFDKAVGHYRRYNRKMLQAVIPPGLQLISIKYLDSTSVLASALNRWVLKQEYPTFKQVKFWDNVLVPVSKLTDRLTAYSAGKTIVGVWQTPFTNNKSN